MRVIIQRVSKASVTVDQEQIGSIDQGLMLLVGIGQEDTQADCDYCIRKIINMRIFEDEAGKMNLSLKEVGGSILSISQFTLYASCRKGNRPSFSLAADPQKAQALYDYFNKGLKELGASLATGQFAADMKVSLVNDGPVTIILDSKEQS